MILEEFKKTNEAIRKANEYFDNVYASEYFNYDPLFDFELESDTIYKGLIKDIEICFYSELNELKHNQVFFYGCDTKLFINTYLKRLQAFLEENTNVTEIDFLEIELNKMYKVYKNILGSYISEYSDFLKYGIKNQLRYLNDKSIENGYKVLKRNKSKIKLIKIDEFSSIRTTVEDEEYLYEGRNIKEWVLLIKGLGILDHLYNKYEHNINKVAKAIALLINAKQITIQSYINPIYNSENAQHNNPLSNKKILNKVQKELREKDLM